MFELFMAVENVWYMQSVHYVMSFRILAEGSYTAIQLYGAARVVSPG